MNRSTARLLYWSPRIISIAFAIFISLFALEAFAEVHGWQHIALALAIDAVPALILVAVLAAAWKWEWIGAVVFALLAACYVWNALNRHFLSWPIFLGIPVPLLVIAALFLANWIEREKLRAAR